MCMDLWPSEALELKLSSAVKTLITENYYLTDSNNLQLVYNTAQHQFQTIHLHLMPTDTVMFAVA